MESSTTFSTPTETASVSAIATMLPSSNAEITTTTTTTTKDDDSTTQSHYTSHDMNNTYEDAFFYEPGLYMEYLKNLIQEKFNFLTNHSITTTSSSISSSSSSTNNEYYTLVDIGGGTGNFTKEIIKNTYNINAIVVDPYLIGTTNEEIVLSSDSSTTTIISFVKQPAEAYMNNNMESTSTSTSTTSCDENDKELLIVNWKNNYDYVLLKEVIHHLKECDRINIFRGIYNGFNKSRATTAATTLQQTTKLIIITRPQYDIDYPLWDDAKTIWSQNQPSIEKIINELQQSYYTNIHYAIESYTCCIPFSKWEHMIIQRCWSTFTNFTNEQLQSGIQQIRMNENHRINPINDTISFDDRLIIITASI